MLAALLAMSLVVSSAGSAAAAQDDPGAVYFMTNSPGGNAVVAYHRSARGELTYADSYATGGAGSGAGLGSQGALTLTENGQWLLAVNAGSHDVSVFRVLPDTLQLAARTPSGGANPISVTAHGSLVYVLNAGGGGNISGLTLSAQGNLTPLAGSTQALGGAIGPAQVSFSPDGQQLVVTAKATSQILTFDVGQDGLASAPTAYPSAGATPFGFGFSKQNTLIVSEAFGGAANASAVSSYRLGEGSLQTVSPSVATTQTAACWIAVTGNGKYAYATNAGSGSISGYAVGNDGSLTLADAQAGLTTGGPLDAAFSVNSQFLYVLTGGGTPVVAAFQVGSDGSLTSLGEVSIPAGSQGLAAR